MTEKLKMGEQVWLRNDFSAMKLVHRRDTYTVMVEWLDSSAGAYRECTVPAEMLTSIPPASADSNQSRHDLQRF